MISLSKGRGKKYKGKEKKKKLPTRKKSIRWKEKIVLARGDPLLAGHGNAT